MIRNMSTADRAIRAFVVAPVLVVAALAAGATGVLGVVLLALAAVMLATAAAGHCPLYRLVGVSTCPRRPAAL